MKDLIKTKSFKDFIENIGCGCKMIVANIENNNIAVYCKANTQNNIIFKIILNNHECICLVNSYNLYKKEEITSDYQNFLKNLSSSISL